MLKNIPTFVINGILESGKTTFIKDTIVNDDFKDNGTSLILGCEEGMEEYETSFLKKYNCVIKYFDNQNEFTSLNIQKVINEVKPERIIVELNGMWDLNKIAFPSTMKIAQFITFINFETFPIYFANELRQSFLDSAKASDVVVFFNVKTE